MVTTEGEEPELPIEQEDVPEDLMLRDPEAPEADVLDQIREVPIEPDDEPG
jgi:hypothetical protein